MVGNTSFVGRRCTVAAAHPVELTGAGSGIYRFQGVALPKGFNLNHAAYGILEKRAAKLVSHFLAFKLVLPSGEHY